MQTSTTNTTYRIPVAPASISASDSLRDADEGNKEKMKPCGKKEIVANGRRRNMFYTTKS